MKRFKKAVAICVIAAMTATIFVGCGKGNNTSEDVTTEATSEDVSTTEAVSEDTTELTTEEATEEEKETIADGDKVIELTFDKDVENCLTYVNGGDIKLSAKDGELIAAIKRIGKLDYANQIYYDGFKLHQDCVYEFSFDVKCDIERKLQWRFQINGSDYHAYAMEDIDIGPEAKTVTATFTMEEATDPAPRLCFNAGAFDGMAADTAEHNIYFDNIVLTAVDTSKVVTSDSLPEAIPVKVNQLGYKAADYKKATVTSEEATKFDVIDVATGKSIYQGELSDVIKDDPSGERCRLADFSEVVTEGTYKIVTDNGLESYEFDIDNNVYNNIYKDTVLMLYKQRCGVETDGSIAGEFAHGVCHNEKAVVFGTETVLDVSGGWHDAGDYGRYVVPGAKTVADLFLAVEDSELAKADDLGIPESGNNVPDLLDEARYELEWMLKMQDASSGGVYHKVTCEMFPGIVIPEEETDPLVIAPISKTATGDFAAVMAKAAVLYNEYDKDFAATCLAASRNAWAYLKEHVEDSGFKNPKGIETGEYPDSNADDEYLWAAIELYIATDEEEYKTYVTDAVANTKKMPYGLGWADIGMYGIYDYCMYVGDNSDIEEILVKRANACKASSAKDAYGASLGAIYPWGSNMSIANNGMILVMAYHVTEDISYLEPAKYHLDYLLGRNPVGYCYVTGYGDVSPLHTHHRPSQVLQKSMPGMLVGGANSNLEDPYAKAVLLGEAPSHCYVDNEQSYSCNEITIYWNSPLIYLLATLK